MTAKAGGTLLFFLFQFVLCGSLRAQVPAQTVRGTVVDRNTHVPLPGATVMLSSNGFSKGAVSDPEGKFRIEEVPVGRYTIEARFIGYEPHAIPEILVSSARPVVMEFLLREAVSEIEPVEVKAQVRKDIPLNQMATLSARTFTVEETRRYAGGFDDPGRMAASFAGVAGGSPNDNALSIRGNAPKGLSWRVEGVSVPNPNHFAGMLVEGGGVVSLISGQLLNNSDFFTGAFPAEYGNALSGVFDMNLRAGNNEKRGWGLQIGTLGIDVFGEGPFVKGKKASYLVNYRYATTALFKELIPVGQLPIYQDLNIKLQFPTKKAGIFSIWALGGIDQNGSEPLEDSTQWQSSWDQSRYTWNGKIAMGGINHKIILGANTSLNTSLTTALNQFSDKVELLVPGTGFAEYEYIQNFTTLLSLRSVMTHRFSRKLSNRTGFVFGRSSYDIKAREADPDIVGLPVLQDNSGAGITGYLQGFTQFRWSPIRNLSMTGGVNSMLFLLNNSLTFEPRFGIDYRFLNENRISAAYGNHGQIEPLPAYFYSVETAPGVIEKPNLNLSPTRSHHFVLAYKRLLAKELVMNFETYYQQLYNVPVSPEGNYSMINFKNEYLLRDSLVNEGKGNNIGIDLTLEKYLRKNYYFLLTGSVFDSKYTGGDGQTYNTRWDYGWVVNFLGGREFFVGQQKTNILGINARMVYQGGERTHPVDDAASRLEQKVVYDYSRAWESRFPNTFFIDFTVTFRVNKQRYASIWGIQIKNILLEKSIYDHVWNTKTQAVEVKGEGFIFPNISYKIEF
ncbi:carboxypeptidase regulatory-like domain-containing protein [Bacteroidota bacterium]